MQSNYLFGVYEVIKLLQRARQGGDGHWTVQVVAQALQGLAV